MQEKLLYLQVKSEPKAAKSGKNREFEWVSKMAQKSKKERTWRERRELRREQNPPFPTYFSGTLKILLERTFTPFFCC